MQCSQRKQFRYSTPEPGTPLAGSFFFVRASEVKTLQHGVRKSSSPLMSESWNSEASMRITQEGAPGRLVT